MNTHERALLVAAMRWARAEDRVERVNGYEWTRHGLPTLRWSVAWEDPESPKLTIWRGRTTAKEYWVEDIPEAIDVLCALGILPPRFSTAYRSGWDAGYESTESGVVGADYRAIVPVADAGLVRL